MSVEDSLSFQPPHTPPPPPPRPPPPPPPLLHLFQHLPTRLPSPRHPSFLTSNPLPIAARKLHGLSLARRQGRCLLLVAAPAAEEFTPGPPGALVSHSEGINRSCAIGQYSILPDQPSWQLVFLFLRKGSVGKLIFQKVLRLVQNY